MKFKFKLSVPARPDGHVTATTECGPDSAEWSRKLTELASQAADATPEEFPRELAGHPGRLDISTVDDFMDRL